jgi:hypothetical protein
MVLPAHLSEGIQAIVGEASQSQPAAALACVMRG